jgi:hypothetical protein
MAQKGMMKTDQETADPPKRKRWAYVNARDVFPPELLAAVQQHFSGGFIYVPPPESEYFAERRKLVLALHFQGVPTAEIARMASVTPRRARQILAQAKGKSKK